MNDNTPPRDTLSSVIHEAHRFGFQLAVDALREMAAHTDDDGLLAAADTLERMKP